MNPSGAAKNQTDYPNFIFVVKRGCFKVEFQKDERESSLIFVIVLFLKLSRTNSKDSY